MKLTIKFVKKITQVLLFEFVLKMNIVSNLMQCCLVWDISNYNLTVIQIYLLETFALPTS